MDGLSRSGSDPQRIAEEAAWLAQVAAGGSRRTAAWQKLYLRYHAAFIGKLQRFVPRETANDLAQQVWIDVLAKAGDFRIDAGTPYSWLWGFVRTSLTNWLGAPDRKGRSVSADDESHAAEIAATLEAFTVPGPEAGHVLSAMHRCVRDAFDRFKRRHPQEAWLLYWRHVEDWSLDDIARFRASTVHAAAEFLSQVRRKFSPLIRPCLD